jgi:hypothetical protein
MPVTLTSTNLYGAGTVSAPAAGEPRTSLSVRTGLQQLLNMTGFLKSVLDGGVTRLRTTADLAALKALTGQTTGDHAVVKNLGIYEFDAASALTVAEPVVVQPTVGGGRWLHVNRSTGVANGFATLDATAKVPAAQCRGQIISHTTATIPSSSGTISAPGVIGTTLASVTLTPGQSLDVFCNLLFKKTSGTDTDGKVATLGFNILNPTPANEDVPGSQMHTMEFGVGSYLSYGIQGRYFASLSGTHQLRLSTGGIVPTTISYEILNSTVHLYVREASLWLTGFRRSFSSFRTGNSTRAPLR